MNELEFRKWLNKKGVSKKMQSDHTSRIKRIEKEINHCDIDNEYHNDKQKKDLQINVGLFILLL